MNNNPKNNILMSEKIKQKRLTVLEYFDAYTVSIIYMHRVIPKLLVFFCLIFSDTKMLFFGLSFILFALNFTDFFI